MNTWKLYCPLLILSLAVAVPSASASITNGTFDSNLTGWSTAGTTTGVTWIGGEARVGQPGTPGVAILEQSFDIPTGVGGELQLSFDYEWQVQAPTNPDTFDVVFSYESTSGTQIVPLLSQTSDAATFGPPASNFSTIISIGDLANVANNGTITFQLTEVNTDVGTRVHVDNVGANVIPEATTFATWSILASLGIMKLRRRRS